MVHVETWKTLAPTTYNFPQICKKASTIHQFYVAYELCEIQGQNSDRWPLLFNQARRRNFVAWRIMIKIFYY